MTSFSVRLYPATAWAMLAGLLLLTSACGWQLRGAGLAMPDDLSHIYIEGNTAVAAALRQSLTTGDRTLAAHADDADVILRIISDRFDQRTATISASARISERRMTHEVEYLIVDNSGEPIFPPGRLDIERIYEYNEDNVLATDDEVVMLREEMLQDLVRQLQMRLIQASSREASGDAVNSAPVRVDEAPGSGDAPAP